MSLKRKVAYNTLVQIVGKVVTTVISLFLVAALTRYLGVTGYGQYTTVFSYVAFFAVFADFGFFWIFIRELAKPDADTSKIASNILTLRTILGIVVYGLAFVVGFFIPQYYEFRWGIGITALASLFLALNFTYVGVFQNKLRMDKAALTDMIGRAVILVVTLYLIKSNLGLNAILWAYAFGNIVNFVISAWLGRIYVHFRPAFDFKYWKEIFWQALPMGIILVLNLIYFRVDTLILSLLKSSTDVGIYGPPYKVLEIMLFLPTIFMGNIFPIITRFYFEKNPRLNELIQKAFDFLFMMALPIIVGVIFAARPIIEAVAGVEFVNASTVQPFLGIPATSVLALQILIIAVGVSFLSHLFGYLAVAFGKQSKLVVPNIIFVVFNIGLNLILIPRFSYIGASIVTVLTESLVLVISWLIMSQYLKVNWNFRIFWKVVLASLFLGIFMYFAKGLNLLILLPTAVVVYVVSLLAVGGVNKRMVTDIISGK